MTTDLIPRTTISDICAARDAAMATIKRAVEAMTEGLRLAEQAQGYAEQAHGAAGFYEEDRRRQAAYQRLFEPLDAEASLEMYRRQVDASTWVHLMNLTGVRDMMDRTAKEEMDKALIADVPVISEANIEATFERLAGDAHLIFQRGLARAFIELDRRFRSHDGFKIGGRIVLTNVFDDWGHWNPYGYKQSTIVDVERTFMVLDGNGKIPRDANGNSKQPRRILNAIHADRKGGFSPHQSVTEADYFRVRCYKNGNAHLWFTRDDLVEKANRVLADYYGQVLPDGVPADVTVDDISTCTALCRDLQFYRTPAKVIETILRDVWLKDNATVLEPSAGEGDIVRALLAQGARVEAVEVDETRVAALRLIERNHGRLTVHHRNFLRMTPTPRFTHVVMNPPFHGTHYMSHVLHAWEWLKHGGTLVAVLPATVEFNEGKKFDAFRAWIKEHSRRRSQPYRDLPLESFASSGTRINTCWIQLEKGA